jgi:diguanylate cyclase (GGDEF)-like protein
MKSLAYPESKWVPLVLSILAYAGYAVIFATFHPQLGSGLAAISTIPVLLASWYFGIGGGLFMAVLSIFTNIVVLNLHGQPQSASLLDLTNEIRIFSLLVIAVAVGKLRDVSQERSTALLKLQQYEQGRQEHTSFLELLNEITALALEADNLNSTLTILGERILLLFEADDCFFSLWDETKDLPVPFVAYGSMRDVFPFVQFEPGERTLGTAVLEAGHPIAVPNLEDSPHISPSVASIYPSRSMMGLPLIAQGRRLGALLVGYKKACSFDESDLLHAQLTAEQVSLVLFKTLLLEEERKQVKQLTALHDIAQIAVEADNADELIRRVTDLIGRNLFTDNFGILLLDEQAGVLYAHPSYRFFSAGEHEEMVISLDQGITGRVAQTGKAVRVGNVRKEKEYLQVDERTVSELCVPIKLKERILGVINAESTKRDAFTEDDERILITLAGQIATALEQIHKAQAERKWLDQLAHSNDLIYALAQITTHIEKAFGIDEIIQNLGAELSKIDLSCHIALYNQEREVFTIKYTSLESRFVEMIEHGLGYPFLGYTFSRTKLPPGNLFHPTVVSNTVEEIQMLFPRLSKEGVTVLLDRIEVGRATEPLRLPLVFEENLLGILWIWGKGLTKADLPIMSIFAKQIGISLERARLFQEVQSLALTDPLTGLQNRRSLFELGRVEFARAQRMNRPFCCLMLDLDHFKHVNDEYGHLIGDQVLREFARRCSSLVREVDLIGRYGGEELIILMPETDRDTAMRVAERLRAAIAATPIKILEKEIVVTTSIGVATQDEHTMDLETLIARADQALYIAKHKGRNRVSMSK